MENSTRRQFYQSYLTVPDVQWKDYDEGQRLDEGRSNENVNYRTRMSQMEFIPPYYAGSVKSKLIKVLRKGHGKTSFNDREIETVAAWIDLNVPFIGAYDEMNMRTDEEVAMYTEKMAMRKKKEEIERLNIQQFIKDGQPR